MEELIGEMKNIHQCILDYLDDEESNNQKFSKLCQLYNDKTIKENPNKFSFFLFLISKIVDNYHRSINLFKKIEQILLHYDNQIKQTFSNHEIFYIFQNNRRIILFLIKHNFITVDQYIFNILESKSDKFLIHIYLYPEIQSFINQEKKQIINTKDKCFDDNFDQKREDGENESYLCYLIRNDLVEDFISHVNRYNISLTSKISRSIYETNDFLIKKEPTIIEYAAFYGSNQIFVYLKFSNVELTPSLWLYAIHGNNPDIIHILEENNVGLDDKNHSKWVIESIKCHNESITNYLIDQYMTFDMKNKYKDIFFRKSLKYYNFSNTFDVNCYESYFYFSVNTVILMLLNFFSKKETFHLMKSIQKAFINLYILNEISIY